MSPFLVYFCNNNKKSVLGNDPLQKNSRVKTPVYHTIHLTPLHSALRIPPSHRFIKDGIAETLYFVKRQNSNQDIPSSIK